MTEAKRELVQAWLNKAASDLGTARKNMFEKHNGE